MTTLRGLIQDITVYLRDLIPIFMIVALLYFLWGCVEYIRDASNEKGRAEARIRILHGILGLFAIVSVWGLVGIIQNTFDLDNSLPRLPQFSMTVDNS